MDKLRTQDKVVLAVAILVGLPCVGLAILMVVLFVATTFFG